MQQKKVVFDALLYKKHPVAYCRWIRRQPPWLYYTAVAAIGAALVAKSAGNVIAGIAGLALWIALTALFSWRRLRSTRKSASHVIEMLATSALIPPVSVFWRIVGAWRFRVLFL